MQNKTEQIATWLAEIRIHSNNLASLPDEMQERGIPKEDYFIFRFTSLEIATFYTLHQLAHKWKKTTIFINGNLIKYSPDVTKVFRCCFEASDWPQRQNEWYKRDGRPQKQLETKHYCYGYARTIHNIAGCQKISAARDKDLPAYGVSPEDRKNRVGWMNSRFIRINNDRFEVNIEALSKEMWKEYNSAPNLCPYIVKERITYALNVLETSTKAASNFWIIERGKTLNPQPIEYYFDMKLSISGSSQFAKRHSLVYFIILANILELSLYETVKLIALENPSLGFSIGIGEFRPKKVYVKFDSLEQLSRQKGNVACRLTSGSS